MMGIGVGKYSDLGWGKGRGGGLLARKHYTMPTYLISIEIE